MKWFGAAFSAGTFAVLYFYERRRPLRPPIERKETQTARNLAIASAAGAASFLLENPIADRLTKYVETERFGLLKIFHLPKVLETVLAVILLDYTLYLWHVLTHKVPFLWRFHRVHHADLDLAASTAVRFHFGEITISVLFRAGQILLVGVAPNAFQIWQTLLFTSIFFHHSNVRLPKDFEKSLQKFIVTPRLHGIHHSTEESEMNSNWSSGLNVWDKLHGTFRADLRQNEITIGLKEFAEQEDVTLGKMFIEPFRKKNYELRKDDISRNS